MDAVFIGITILLAAFGLTAHYTAHGVGSMGPALRQLGLFALTKMPAGIVDMFEEKPGSGSRTWINFGLFWFILASISGFLAAWHRYDPTALDSLASVYWSYDDGSAIEHYTTLFMTNAVIAALLGAALNAAARSNGGSLASESSASMTALLFTTVSILGYSLPSLLALFGVEVIGGLEILILAISTVVIGMIMAAVLINVLITVAGRNDEDVSTSAWFLIFGLLSAVMSEFLVFFGIMMDSGQIVWLAERVGGAWVILSLMFSVGYHIIPMTTGTPIWSGSLRKANMVLLYGTVPAVFMTGTVTEDSFLVNTGALLLTFGILPIIAGSVNLTLTAFSNAEAIVKSPGALAATLAMMTMPFFIIGAYFTGMSVYVGTGSLGEMAGTVDMGFMWTIGGLMVLAAAFTSLPQSAGKALANSSTASMAMWAVFVGGLLSTITNLLGDFTTQAVANSGIEDAVAQTGGFHLTGSAFFYLVTLGSMFAASVAISTNAGAKTSSTSSAGSDISSYNLGTGKVSIRALLSRGVGLDTTILVGMEEEEVSSTVIAVSADLHNDEVSEFPEDSEETPEELVMLATYLAQEGQSVFEFFRSIDLDDSGKVDGFELQRALKAADIANLPPWDMGALVAAVDLDGDGMINLPELDIALAQIRSDNGIEVASKKEEAVEEAEEEAAEESEETEEAAEDKPEIPSITVLNKMKKDELIALAEEIGVDATGTKKDLVAAIVKA